MNFSSPLTKRNNSLFNIQFCLAFVVLSLAVLSPEVFAQTNTDAAGKVCGFFTSLGSLLKIASIAVVTIAIIFAGYQIAFAHKRISDVAPILIGGLLIGAAGQIATMILGTTDGCLSTASIITNAVTQLV